MAAVNVFVAVVAPTVATVVSVFAATFFCPATTAALPVAVVAKASSRSTPAAICPLSAALICAPVMRAPASAAATEVPCKAAVVSVAAAAAACDCAANDARIPAAMRSAVSALLSSIFVHSAIMRAVVSSADRFAFIAALTAALCCRCDSRSTAAIRLAISRSCAAVTSVCAAVCAAALAIAACRD